MVDLIETVKQYNITNSLPVSSQLINVKDTQWKQFRLDRLNLQIQKDDRYIEAEYSDDPIMIMSALADIIHTAISTTVAYGIPLEKVFQLVNQQTFTNGVEENLIVDEDGNFRKPSNRIVDQLETIKEFYNDNYDNG